MKTVLLYSGGLDSTIARYYLLPDMLIYIDLGVAYSDKEKARLPTETVVVPMRGVMAVTSVQKQTVPFRNMMFAQIAYNLAVAKWPEEELIRVAVVGVKEDNTEDKNEQAFVTMTNALNLIRPARSPRIEIVSPFWNMTKRDMVLWLKENEKDWKKILSNVITCFSEHGHRCGECWACVALWTTLVRSGIDCKGWFDYDVRNAASIFYDKPDFLSKIWEEEVGEALGRKA